MVGIFIGIVDSSVTRPSLLTMRFGIRSFPGKYSPSALIAQEQPFFLRFLVIAAASGFRVGLRLTHGSGRGGGEAGFPA